MESRSHFFVFVLLFCCCCHLSRAKIVSADVRCFADSSKVMWFSVLLQDGGDITSADTIRAMKATSVCTTAPTVTYFKTGDLSGEARFTNAPTGTTATATTHDFTRIQINLKICSQHTLQDVVATTEEVAKKKHIFDSSLEILASNLFVTNTYNLKCSYLETTDDTSLTISANIGAPLKDEDNKYSVDIEFYKVDPASSSKTLITKDSGGLYQMNLGDETEVKAKILGDVSVETAIASIKICKEAACTTTADVVELISPYGGNGNQIAANQQWNCLSSILAPFSSRFKITAPSAAASEAVFTFPVFRYSKSSNNAQIFFVFKISICKGGESSSNCRKTCISASGRRRRSAGEDGDVQTLTKVVKMNVVSNPGDCSDSRLNVVANCTDGARVGSVCRYACRPGFAALSGPTERRCLEKIVDHVGPIYYGTKAEWTVDGTPKCEDINECLQTPCASGFFCRNTPGSYSCDCPLGSKLSAGKCLPIKTE